MDLHCELHKCQIVLIVAFKLFFDLLIFFSNEEFAIEISTDFLRLFYDKIHELNNFFERFIITL
nr:MAG TPA: hypothetical protein [Caudoviricetes sp.]